MFYFYTSQSQNTELNSLLYANDLIIFSRSKIRLQNCLHKFSSFFFFFYLFNYILLELVFTRNSNSKLYKVHMNNSVLQNLSLS